MFSQSLFAQLIRMVTLLIVTLYAVHQWQPFEDTIAEHAMSSGCHQQNSIQHQHMEHH